MEKNSRLALVLTFAFILLVLNLLAGDGVFSKEFMPLLENSEKYSIEMIQLMPEEEFSFKPVPEIMSFAEQNVHIASAIYKFASAIKGEEPPVKEFTADGKSKAEIIQFLADSYVYAKKVLAELTDEEAAQVVNFMGQIKLTKKELFMLLKDHTTHHRGQMVIYLRLKGIKPARYRR